MTSKIKVDNINKVSDDSNIIKKCGTTTTIGSGASNPIVVDGSAVTLGRCGGTVALASGATQTGFGRTGTVDWQTTPKTGDFTAVNGEGYFVNTTSGAVTMTMPSGSAGAIVSIQDYNKTFDSNNFTVTPASGEKINGGSASGVLIITTEGQGLTFVYVDATVGWKTVQENDFTAGGTVKIVATVSGACNTLTEDGDFKIATFKGPGNFTVSQVSDTAAENTIGYMIVAGGGSGGSKGASVSNFENGAGGGAGGFREGRNVPIDNFTASPIVANAPTNAITLTAQTYPIVVGGGGSGSPSSGAKGSDSSFAGLISAGGGRGGGPNASCTPGGSGGGEQNWGGGSNPSGNTPPVSPPQGQNGGAGAQVACASGGSGGGGGAGEAGVNGSGNNAGRGGAGVPTAITGSALAYAGGGGGSSPGPQPGGPCGTGGAGGGNNPGGNGTTNRGGGGGGSGQNGSAGNGGNGGSGVVVIRYKFQ